jgi:hypothetical protein
MGSFSGMDVIGQLSAAVAIAAAALLGVLAWRSWRKGRNGAPSRGARAYLLTFALGAISTVLLCIGAVAALSRFAPEHLPPPPISNHISFDEKLLLLRHQPDLRPSILGAGSSITLRTLDGSAFQPEGARPVFFNAGLAGGQIHQIRFATSFFLELFPTVETIVQMVVPPDFADCTSEGPSFFNPRDARAFARGRMSPARAYLKYFNPQELILEALTMAAKRRGWDEGAAERLYMDAFGTMPMQVSAREARQRHRDLYNHLDPIDPSCLLELKRWSRDLAARGKRLYIVIPPTSPIHLQQVPGATRSVEEFVAALHAALEGESAILVDMRDEPLGSEGFADAYHMQWTAARQFSRKLADLVRQNRAQSAAALAAEYD